MLTSRAGTPTPAMARVTAGGSWASSAAAGDDIATSAASAKKRLNIRGKQLRGRRRKFSSGWRDTGIHRVGEEARSGHAAVVEYVSEGPGGSAASGAHSLPGLLAGQHGRGDPERPVARAAAGRPLLAGPGTARRVPAGAARRRHGQCVRRTAVPAARRIGPRAHPDRQDDL